MSDRDDLKARAKDLELEHAANIPTDKLQELVEAAEAAKATAPAAQQNQGDAGQPAPQGDQGGKAFEAALEDRAAAATGDPATVEAQSEEDTSQPNLIAALRVQGPNKGFRRAGRDFGSTPVFIQLAGLSEAELAALENEPRLMASRVMVAPE